ncbi:MAG: hypothetical protein ACE5HY_00415 [Candidatus Hydrothermarchaeales archaeon]
MIRGLFFIEAQGNNKAVVEDSLEKLVEKMKTEGYAEVKNTSFDETVEKDGNFSKTAEVEATFKDLQDYMVSVIAYGPSAMEILEPKNLVMPSKEFIKTLGDILVLTKEVYAKYGVFFKYVKPRGYKPEIGLSEDEIDSLLGQGAIRIKMVVETKETNRRKAIAGFIKTIEEDLFVNKVKTKKLDGSEGSNLLIAIEAFLYEPKDLVATMVQHTPVLLEIVEPDEIELKQLDIQDIGVELARIYFDLAHRLAFHIPEPTGKFY